MAQIGKFTTSKEVLTPGALKLLREEGDPIRFALELLDRHRSGDWGDVWLEDAEANERALKDGSRLWSVYILPKSKQKIWVITEAVGPNGKRASTCLLKPGEY